MKKYKQKKIIPKLFDKYRSADHAEDEINCNICNKFNNFNMNDNEINNNKLYDFNLKDSNNEQLDEITEIIDYTFNVDKTITESKKSNNESETNKLID